MEIRLVGNRYEVGELIGYGGMAEVHRGRDVRLGRDVAVKILRSDLARDPAFLARFRREAQSSAGLNHPAIVAVYDTGEEPATDEVPEIPYIVMEFIEGSTLRDVLKTQGFLPVRQAMEITAEVCAALDFSHRNGIVHRDIKPANVMITPSGQVKVMDFGIARALADGAATATQTAAVIGTAQYLSPEQARGESVDARSDVYSVGCLLYELLTGTPPFQGDSPVAVAYQHVRENAPIPSSRHAGVPRVLDSITMKALAKNPLNRYQSAGEMRLDLQRAIADEPVHAESVLTDEERTQFIARVPSDAPMGAGRRRAYEPPEPDDSGRRNGLIWLAVVVALLLVIGAAAYAVVLVSKKDEVKKVAVPTAVGLAPNAATDRLAALGFNPVIAPQPSNGPCGVSPATAPQTVDEGDICTQDPAAASDQPKGTTITLTIYKIPPVTLGSYVGMDISTVTYQLAKLGLKVTQVQVDSLKKSGTVLIQDPPTGTSEPVGSTVTLTVASGTAPVPNVAGLTEQQATDKLKAFGFTTVNVNPTPVTTDEPTKNALVAAYAPQTGNWPASQPITLALFKYKKPGPTCTTPPPSSRTTTSGAKTSPGGTSAAVTSPTPTPTPTPVDTSTGTPLPACR